MCFGGNAGEKEAARVQQENAAAELRRTQATERVNNVFGVGAGAATNAAARQGLYGKVEADTVAFLKDDADRQRADATRNLRFNLARTGQAGGSLAVDQGREVDDAYQRGILEVALRGQGARTAAQNADEQARTELIARINAGMSEGDALTSAGRAMAASLDTARQQALVNGLGGLFDNLAWAQQYSRQGGADGVAPGGSTLGSNTLGGKNSSGQITRG